MADLLACRVCLATNVKLYNMYKYHLKMVFENLTGIPISLTDNYPHSLCVFCAHLLIKSNTFKQRCLHTQELLKDAAFELSTVTTEDIKSLSFQTSPTHSLSISHLQTATTLEAIFPLLDDIKDLKTEHSDSDEEPLAEKVKKKKVKSEYPEFNFNDSNINTDVIDYTGFENDSFDKRKDLEFSEFEFDDSFETEAFDIGVMEDSELNSHDIEVVVLSKEQQIQEVLNRKESYNYQNSFYKCELCYKGFITDATFKNHMARHDLNSGPHSCDICHTRWPDLRSLKAHTTITHERKYICKLCTHTTKSLHRAREHLKWHSGHMFVCKICGASFAKSTSYMTHLRLQHPSQFSCDDCGESYISQNGLNMHKKKAHRSENSNTKSHFACTYCGVKFKTSEALRHHSSISKSGMCDTSQSPCPDCGDTFSSQELLKEHLKTAHKDESVKCDECDRSFAHERSFAVHYQRVHLGIKRNSPANEKYKRRHRMRSAVVCEICGKKCISNATLVYHQRIHTGEKPFQCNECPKKFSVYQRLQIHIRTHTGERPFKCSHCPKAFKHKAALNRHDRVHTGAKPYQCSHCSKSFSQSNSMKLHVRTVHLKMPAPYRNRRTSKPAE